MSIKSLPIWCLASLIAAVCWCWGERGGALAEDEPASQPSTTASSQDDSTPTSESAGETAPALKLTKKWLNLYIAGKARPMVEPLPEDSLLEALSDLTFTGPKPGHPFILGEFTSDGNWAIDKGLLMPVEGKNTALKLLRAGDFELEGTIGQEGLGGWFMLLGWDQGHGYVICNATMKTVESGSPWFIAELRGGKPIEDTIEELPKFDWQGPALFRLRIGQNELSINIGNKVIFDKRTLSNYTTGDVILGTYDTKYGPKKVGIKSLRVRAAQ